MAYSRLLVALARAFRTDRDAVNLIEDAELPSHRLVPGHFDTSEDGWRAILRKLVSREPDGLAKLCTAAAAAMPGEDAFVLSYQDLEQIEQRCRQPDPDTSPPNTSPLYGVPDARAVDFIGRDVTMGQLQELLLKEGSVRVAPSLEGLAGIGKTEIALQLVYQLADQGAFPGGIFWFDAENPDLAPVWGSQIADRLAIPTATALERAAHALNLVSQSAKATLIVLDNVETWGGDQSPGPLPSGAHLRYLLTTRSKNLGGRLFQHFPIGFLKSPYDRDLLISAAVGRDLLDDENVEALLEHLGGHALALELAGAFLGEFPDQTPASYLESIQAGASVDERASDLVRYRSTVSQAFATIWERIDTETRDAWRLASCFAPEMVSPELSESVGLSGDVLHGLRRLHLVEMGGSGGWRMHRLIQEFGRCAGTDEELGEARRRFVAGCAEYSDRIELADGFRVYLPVRSHLDRALSQAEEALGAEDFRWSKFLDRIGAALMSIGDFPGACKLREKALDLDLENLGEQHPSVATSRSNLAAVLQALGDLSGARDHLEIALASALENLGEKHPSVATSRSNLAMVLKDLGDLSGARDHLEIALASDLENLGEQHPSVATSRSNLAMVLKDLGDLSGARDHLEIALASDLENLGEQHPSVAILRFNIAMVCREEGDFESARALFETALTALNLTLGANHPFLALTRSRLGEAYAALGESAAAEREASEALRVVSSQPEGSTFRRQVEQITAKILEPS